MVRILKRKILFSLAGVVIAGLLGFAVSQYISIGLNRSSSLPGSVYLIIKSNHAPKLGELVVFRPGRTPVYENQTFTKRVGGVAGDVVTRQDGVYSINGVAVCVAKKYGKDGRELFWGPTGVIPPGYIFVYSDHPDGYDSRYADIGWVPIESVVGRAYELL